ncbi:MAG: DUF3068 domain-containing protein [Candidatus Nanopelagicales bacterium]
MLIALGAALLVLAPMVKFYAVPKLAVAPMDLDPNEPSLNEGVAEKLLDIGTLTELTNVPVTSTRYTTADVAAAAAAGGNTGVYETFSRVNREGGELVTASTQRYAFDRTTNIMSTGSNANIDGEPITDAMIADDAIMPLKLPFFVDKNATYNYFDTSLLKGFPLTFVEETQIDGLTVYKFESKIPATQIGEQEGLADKVGSTDPNYKAPRFYTNYRVIYAEPLTGQVVDGFEDQLQTFRGPDGTDKITIIKAKIGFTPENKASAVEQAKTNSAKLGLVANTIPVVSAVVGLVLLVLGILLARRPEGSDA